MVRILTLIVLCITLNTGRESSAQILRGRQRSYVQAPQQTPPVPPRRTVPPGQAVPPGQTVPPGRPPGAPTTPNEPTPAVPGNSPHNPEKPWYECEDCTPTTDCKGDGPCQDYNPPKIISSDGPGCETTTCVPMDNKPVGSLPSVDGRYTPFYKQCVPFKAKIEVPHYVLNKADSLVFAKQKYPSDCCTFEVCVAVCCCTTTSRTCALHGRDCDLSICIRQNDHIDVYVVDVPGMPKRWVLYLDLTRDQLRAKFPDFRGL